MFGSGTLSKGELRGLPPTPELESETGRVLGADLNSSVLLDRRGRSAACGSDTFLATVLLLLFNAT
eukprot:1005259-Prorocentrum_minimum.AAC.2